MTLLPFNAIGVREDPDGELPCPVAECRVCGSGTTLCAWCDARYRQGWPNHAAQRSASCETVLRDALTDVRTRGGDLGTLIRAVLAANRAYHVPDEDARQRQAHGDGA